MGRMDNRCPTCGFPCELLRRIRYPGDDGDDERRNCPFCESDTGPACLSKAKFSVENRTKEKIVVFLRYRHWQDKEESTGPYGGYETRRYWRWYPDSGWLRYSFKPGESGTLIDDGWTIWADYVRVWAESRTGAWSKYRNVALKIGGAGGKYDYSFND